MTDDRQLRRAARARGSLPRSPVSGRQGLSPGQVSHQLEFQSYRCMLCKGALGSEWAADHDHYLASLHGHDPRRGCQRCFRGILCKACNLMLGWARDDPERLEAAAAYVRAAREAAGA